MTMKSKRFLWFTVKSDGRDSDDFCTASAEDEREDMRKKKSG